MLPASVRIFVHAPWSMRGSMVTVRAIGLYEDPRRAGTQIRQQAVLHGEWQAFNATNVQGTQALFEEGPLKCKTVKIRKGQEVD